jgi:hypothetical protein
MHLLGKLGLGIIPVDQKGMVSFGAIDIDKYGKDVLWTVAGKIEELKLPLIPCRTKSGGVHLFVFFKEKTRARIAINFLKEVSKKLDIPDAEIFPKQEKTDDLGNWINLPYFDHEVTERYAIKNGERLDLERFIIFAKERQVLEQDLRSKYASDLSDAPVCLQALCAKGIEAGTKNNVLLNIGVYLKQKFPDSWEKMLVEFNDRYVKPPAKEDTVKRVIKPLRRKDYFYTCAIHPLVDHCDKDACKRCEFGIGDTPVLKIGKLIKLETDPPTWFVEVDEIKIELTTEEVLSQDKFRRVCVERIQKLPFRMRSEDWDELIRQKLESVEIEEAPEDAGLEGQFWRLIEDFCSTRAMAKTQDEVLMGKPWIHKGFIYFRSSDLLKFLEQNKFRDFKSKKVWSTLKSKDAIYKSVRLKGKHVRLWGIREIDAQSEDFDVPNTKTGDF